MPGVPDDGQKPLDAEIVVAYDPEDWWWKDKPSYFGEWSANFMTHGHGHSWEPYTLVRELLCGIQSAAAGGV